jgi:hypothetical protein
MGVKFNGPYLVKLIFRWKIRINMYRCSSCNLWQRAQTEAIKIITNTMIVLHIGIHSLVRQDNMSNNKNKTDFRYESSVLA